MPRGCCISSKHTNQLCQTKKKQWQCNYLCKQKQELHIDWDNELITRSAHYLCCPFLRYFHEIYTLCVNYQREVNHHHYGEGQNTWIYKVDFQLYVLKEFINQENLGTWSASYRTFRLQTNPPPCFPTTNLTHVSLKLQRTGVHNDELYIKEVKKQTSFTYKSIRFLQKLICENFRALLKVLSRILGD